MEAQKQGFLQRAGNAVQGLWNRVRGQQQPQQANNIQQDVQAQANRGGVGNLAKRAAGVAGQQLVGGVGDLLKKDYMGMDKR